MYINRVISYCGAWEKLNFDFYEVYDEIMEIIDINLERYIVSAHKRIENNDYNALKFFRSHIYRKIVNNIKKLKWEDIQILIESDDKSKPYNRILGHLKNKCSLKVGFYSGGVINWVFGDIVQSKNLEEVELSIIIIIDDMTNYIENEFGKNSKHLLEFDESLEILKSLEPLNVQYPFLILGVGFEDINIEVNEIKSQNNMNSSIIVDKSISFEPQHFQAGLGLLSYFGTVLNKKYPDQKAKVKIEQEGLTVRMIVESEDGNQEILEHALHEYGLILSGEKQPNNFYSSEADNIELRMKFEQAKTEIRMQSHLLVSKEHEIKLKDQMIKTKDQMLEMKNDEIARFGSYFKMAFDNQPVITIQNYLTNTQSTVINHKTELSQSYDDLDSLIDLVDDETLKNKLFRIQTALENTKNLDKPEDVKDSGGMKQLAKFLKEADEAGTSASGLIQKGGDVLKLMQKLGRGYNSVAEWCGLPNIPSVFLKV